MGVVFDQRLVEWPQGEGKLGDRLKGFLMQHPVGREMLADAVFDESDVHWRKNLPYFSTTFAGEMCIRDRFWIWWGRRTLRRIWRRWRRAAG